MKDFVMSRWSTLSSVSFDEVVLATLNPKNFSLGPSRENKFYSHGTSSSPNCPSSAGLSSTPASHLGSWCCIPSSWLMLPEGPTALPRQHLGRIYPALTVLSFSPSFPILTFLLHTLPSAECIKILAALLAQELGSGRCHCRYRWSFGFSSMLQSPWYFQEYFIDLFIWIILFTKILHYLLKYLRCTILHTLW